MPAILDQHSRPTTLRPGDKIIFDERTCKISLARNTGQPMHWEDNGFPKFFPFVRNKEDFIGFVRAIAGLFNFELSESLSADGTLVYQFLKANQ